MKLYILISLMLSCAVKFTYAQDHYDYEPTLRAIRKDIERDDIHAVARRTDFALSKMIDKAVESLRSKGFESEASDIEWGYHTQFEGYLTNMVAGGMTDIGDHKPLSEWLALAYAVIELKLGVDECKALHLSDIKTLNYCIPVVFHPCTFPMDSVTITREIEYRNHFDKGAVYYGLVPVITYWAVDIGCIAATSGVGSLFCGLGATLGERVMANWLAPKLSDFVFTKVCGA